MLCRAVCNRAVCCIVLSRLLSTRVFVCGLSSPCLTMYYLLSLPSFVFCFLLLCRHLLNCLGSFSLRKAGFYLASGGRLSDWTNQMRSILNRVSSSFSNNAFYINTGSGHCIIPSNAYYSTSVEGSTEINGFLKPAILHFPNS
jgi:hypothetical protein